MTLYFLAIVLPQDLDFHILQYKEWMLEHYGCKVALKSPAHITLLPPFYLPQEMEKNLLDDLLAIASTISAFTITTQHFSTFNQRTIFIEVAPNKELNDAKKSVDVFFINKVDYKLKIDNRPFHPHITIANRDLSKLFFEEAWAYFQEKKFIQSFTADGISLLRHDGNKWDVVAEAPFFKS